MKKGIFILFLIVLLNSCGVNRDIENLKDNSISNIEKTENVKKVEIKKVDLDGSVTKDMNVEDIDLKKYKKLDDFLDDLDKNELGFNLSKEPFYVEVKNSDGTISFDTVDPEFLKELDRRGETEKKNLLIKEIFKAYKGGKITKKPKSETDMVVESLVEATPQLRTKMILDRPGIIKTHELKELLKNKSNPTKSDKDNLEYIYSLEGDYKLSEKLRIKNGDKKDKSITISGVVKDVNGNKISGALVELLNDKSINTLTDTNGKYNLTFDYFNYSKIRLRVIIDGYSDGYITKFVYEDEKNNVSFNDNNIVLYKPGKSLIIDKTYIKDYLGKKYYIFNGVDDISTYRIPVDGLVFENGTKFNGTKFKINSYQFNKDAATSNPFLKSDTFDSEFGFVGNIMKTFGMGYLQMYDLQTGKELHTDRSNPALFRQKIFEMDALYTNKDKIYTKVTKDDMKKLVSFSNKLCEGKDLKKCYPINRNWLIKERFLRWPAQWIFNKTKGVWQNTGERVVDEKGIIESYYYSIDLNKECYVSEDCTGGMAQNK